MPEPTPTLGRIVLCHAGNAHPAGRDKPLPATVVTTHDDGTVDLNVFGDVATFRGRGQTNMLIEKVRAGEPNGQGQRWWWPPRAAVTAQPPEGGFGPDVKAGGSDLGADGQAPGGDDDAG